MRWLTRKSEKAGAASRKKADRSGAARKRPAPRWARNLARGAAALAVFAIALGGPAWLWQSGWVAQAANGLYHRIAAGMADAGLRVDQVYLEGRHNESAEAIARALDVGRGAPLLSVDIDAARARIERLDWVRIASVEREFPNAIRSCRRSPT